MKKRKFSPETEQHHNFLIYDLSSALPDYMLAFHINKNMNMRFGREEDLVVNNPSAGSLENYSLYVFEEHRDQKYYLLHNLKDENPLMKSYFIFIEGSFHKEMEEEFLDQLRAIADILNVNPVSLSGTSSGKGASKKTIEMINALLTDLEYHISDLSRKKTGQKSIITPIKKDSIKKLYDL